MEHDLTWLNMLPEFTLHIGCPVFDRERLDRGVVVEGGESEGSAVWFPGDTLGGFVRLYRRAPHDQTTYREEDLRPDISRPLGFAVVMREVRKDRHAESLLRALFIRRYIDRSGVPSEDLDPAEWAALHVQADERIARLDSGAAAPTSNDLDDLASAISESCVGPW